MRVKAASQNLEAYHGTYFRRVSGKWGWGRFRVARIKGWVCFVLWSRFPGQRNAFKSLRAARVYRSIRSIWCLVVIHVSLGIETQQEKNSKAKLKEETKTKWWNSTPQRVDSSLLLARYLKQFRVVREILFPKSCKNSVARWNEWKLFN